MTYANMNPDDCCRTCNGFGRFRYEDDREGKKVTVSDTCWKCNGTGRKLFFLDANPAVVSTETGDGFEPARRALQDVKSGRDVIAAAVDVLSASNDPDDIATVRVWRNHLWAQIGAELNAQDRVTKPTVPFDEMLMPFTTQQIAIMCAALFGLIVFLAVLG